MRQPKPIRHPLLEPLRHGFMTREGGVSTGIHSGLNCGLGSADLPSAVAKNRAIATASLDIPVDRLVTLHQVHSPLVMHVFHPLKIGASPPRADAMVTNTPGIGLGILTADCAPLLMVDHAAGIIAAAHVGWRGALANLPATAVKAMEQLGARKTEIAAVVGPCISTRNYLVGQEFQDRFVLQHADGGMFFESAGCNAGKLLFNLSGFIIARLNDAGVSNAASTGHCTYQDEERFFSYRRSCHKSESDYGRLLSAICLS